MGLQDIFNINQLWQTFFNILTNLGQINYFFFLEEWTTLVVQVLDQRVGVCSVDVVVDALWFHEDLEWVETVERHHQLVDNLFLRFFFLNEVNCVDEFLRHFGLVLCKFDGFTHVDLNDV